MRSSISVKTDTHTHRQATHTHTDKLHTHTHTRTDPNPRSAESQLWQTMTHLFCKCKALGREDFVMREHIIMADRSQLLFPDKT